MKQEEKVLIAASAALIFCWSLIVWVAIAKADDCTAIPPICGWDQKPQCVCVYEPGDVLVPSHCVYICTDRK